MPIVFVHGVATRRLPDGQYDKGVEARNAFLQQFQIPGATASAIETPYWGDSGARYRWNQIYLPNLNNANSILELASLPEGVDGGQGIAPISVATALTAQPQLMSFVQGTVGDIAFQPLVSGVGVAETSFETLLLDIARKSFPNAIDLLYGVAAYPSITVDSEQAALVASEAVLAANYALTFETQPPAWIATVQNDGEFVQRLRQEIKPPTNATTGTGETVAVAGFDLGSVFDTLTNGLDQIKNSLGDTVNHDALNLFRQKYQAQIGAFIGDTFVYLEQRKSVADGGPIPQIVADAVRAAADRRSEADSKLVLIGHSMGGDILYDIVTEFLPDIEVDALITVGSQVGLFQELNLFLETVPDTLPPQPQQKPANVRNWINIFDFSDPFGYAIQGIYAPIEEFKFETNANVFEAHSSYFLRPTFYARLKQHLNSIGL